jgi:MarR family transcriptional regulator for hemolysin
MIDRLAEAKLVERRADQDDRRAWRIHLTESSAPIIGDLQSLAGRFLADILDGISPDAQAQALRTLQQVRMNIAAHGAARRAS